MRGSNPSRDIDRAAYSRIVTLYASFRSGRDLGLIGLPHVEKKHDRRDRAPPVAWWHLQWRPRRLPLSPPGACRESSAMPLHMNDFRCQNFGWT